MEILHMIVLNKEKLVSCLARESLFNSEKKVRIVPSEILTFRNISFLERSNFAFPG